MAKLDWTKANKRYYPAKQRKHRKIYDSMYHNKKFVPKKDNDNKVKEKKMSNNLEGITGWIISRKCKREDNVHVKRAVKEAKKLINITGWSQDYVVSACAEDLTKLGIHQRIENMKSPFAYVASILYKAVYPHLLEKHTEEYLNKIAEEEDIGLLTDKEIDNEG